MCDGLSISDNLQLIIDRYSKVADCDLREFEMTDVCGRNLRPQKEKRK